MLCWQSQLLRLRAGKRGHGVSRCCIPCTSLKIILATDLTPFSFVFIVSNHTDWRLTSSTQGPYGPDNMHATMTITMKIKVSSMHGPYRPDNMHVTMTITMEIKVVRCPYGLDNGN